MKNTADVDDLDLDAERHSDFGRAYRQLVVEVYRAAHADQQNGVTLAAGLEALRAGGATDFELNEYALARSLAVLTKIASSSGIEIVVFNAGGKETVH